MKNKIEFCNKDGKKIKCDFVRLDKTLLPLKSYKLLCESFLQSGIPRISEFITFLIYYHEYNDKDKARILLSEDGISSLGKKGIICNQKDLKQIIGKDKEGITTSEIEY